MIDPAERIPHLGLSFEQLVLVLYPTFLIPAAILWYIDLRRRRREAVTPLGLKRIGLADRTHLSDEYDDHKYAEGVESGTEASGEPRWRIKALFVYPIKSCGAVELEASDVDGSGFGWDRKFAWAELLEPQTRAEAPEAEKKPKWTLRTLRQPGFEKLVHVKPEVWVPDPRAERRSRNESDAGGVLVIRYPNVPTGNLRSLDNLAIKWGLMSSERSFTVPLVAPPEHQYPREEVTVWKDSPSWLNVGVHVPDDFRGWLGVHRPLTLFRADPSAYREVHRNAPRRERLGYQPAVGFVDSYPIHLLNLASVRNVAAKVKAEIPTFSARRFRPNMLVTGPAAYDEDDWKRVEIGGHEFHCACRTVRCRLPNVDPDSSERHPVEPDRTLRSFRCIDDGDPKNACLGLQLVPAQGQGFTVRVGDRIEVRERGEHHYIKQ